MSGAAAACAPLDDARAANPWPRRFAQHVVANRARNVFGGIVSWGVPASELAALPKTFEGADYDVSVLASEPLDATSTTYRVTLSWVSVAVIAGTRHRFAYNASTRQWVLALGYGPA